MKKKLIVPSMAQITRNKLATEIFVENNQICIIKAIYIFLLQIIKNKLSPIV